MENVILDIKQLSLEHNIEENVIKDYIDKLWKRESERLFTRENFEHYLLYGEWKINSNEIYTENNS